MKKDGSSSSASKTPTNSPEASQGSGKEFIIGHEPSEVVAGLDADSGKLFRAFQANLLSLISHELRTPLMGILNALMLLEEQGGAPGENALSSAELVRMARNNAQRLQRTLTTLLDLASLEAGNFHVRLREVHLSRLVRARLAEMQSFLREQSLSVEVEAGPVSAPASGKDGDAGAPVLADPLKLGRVIDLCLEVLAIRAERAAPFKIKVGAGRIDFILQLTHDGRRNWDEAWSHALIAKQSGFSSPSSAFGGVVQSEEAFLTRTEEGLGGELLLIHEILKHHKGELLAATGVGGSLQVSLVLPSLSNDEGVRAVLSSRIYGISGELRCVGLVLVEVPKGAETEEFSMQIRKTLFRSSDTAYAMPEARMVALILEDCRKEDAPHLMERIQKNLGRRVRFGVAECPADSLDPADLIRIAAESLVKSSRPA